MKHRLAVKLMAALTAFGAVFAMAATLGVNSNDLGAGTSTVASCDTTVTVDYSAPTFSSGAYKVSGVTVEGIADACVGQQVAVALEGSSGLLGKSSSSPTVSDTTVLTADDNSVSLTLDGAVDAQSVTKAHVTIAE